MKQIKYSEIYEIFNIIIFQDNDNENKFGFSIHAPDEKANSWKCEPVIVHFAKFDTIDDPLKRAKTLIDCMIGNDIDYHDLIFGREAN